MPRNAAARGEPAAGPGSGGTGGFTVDTPAPYRLADLLRLLDEGMGRLENRSEVPIYQRLIARIRSLSQDPRYAFMFADANIAATPWVETLDGLFNLTDQRRRITVMQLAGLPAEVVDFRRLGAGAAWLSSSGCGAAEPCPCSFVCEEAHRYAPAERHLGFGPTKKAISRIAKEGRKLRYRARPGDPAPRRSRSADHLAMQYIVRHAHGQ